MPAQMRGGKKRPHRLAQQFVERGMSPHQCFGVRHKARRSKVAGGAQSRGRRYDLDSRGGESNRTDVVQLNAELLGVEDRGTEYLASVRFSGLIRESAGASAEPFSEIWNLSKAVRKGEGWLLAGIQQSALH